MLPSRTPVEHLRGTLLIDVLLVRLSLYLLEEEDLSRANYHTVWLSEHSFDEEAPIARMIYGKKRLIIDC